MATSRRWFGSLVLAAAAALWVAGCGGSSPKAAPDTTAPLITGVTPSNGATDVAVNTSLVIAFNEAISESTLALGVQPAVTLGTPAWSASSTQVTIPFTGGLEYATDYAVTVGAEDVAGNPLAGTVDFSFRTVSPPDATPPALGGYSPADLATNQPIGVNLTFTFSEPMNRSSVEGALSIVPAPPSGGVCVWGWTSDSTYAQCDLTQNLNYSTITPSYTVTMGTGAMDAAGNHLEAATSFTFSTVAEPDTTPPTVTSTAPAAAATSVLPDTNISITFSEPMDQSNTAAAFQITSPNGLNGGVVTWADGGRTLVYDVPTNLAVAASVTFQVGTGARDIAGNPLGAAYSSTFTVAHEKTVDIYPEWDGYIVGASTVDTSGVSMVAGDSVTNIQAKSAFSFSHSLITPTPVRIDGATLHVYQANCVGSPYCVVTFPQRCLCLIGQVCWLAPLQAQHAVLGTSLDASDWSATALATHSFGTNSGAVWRDMDVLSDLLADRTASRTRSQWRLEFEEPTDGDGVADACVYSTSEATSNRPYVRVHFYY
jgi:hypothetical protein